MNELLGLGSEPLPNVFMAVPTIYVNLIDEIQNRNLDKVRVFSRFPTLFDYSRDRFWVKTS